MLTGTEDVERGASSEDDDDNDAGLLVPEGVRDGMRLDEGDGDRDGDDEIVKRGGRMDGGGMSLESNVLVIDGSVIKTGA